MYLHPARHVAIYLGRISKRGSKYLRPLFIQAANVISATSAIHARALLRNAAGPYKKCQQQTPRAARSRRRGDLIAVGQCPGWVKMRNTRKEQMISALSPDSDIPQYSRHVSKVPTRSRSLVGTGDRLIIHSQSEPSAGLPRLSILPTDQGVSGYALRVALNPCRPPSSMARGRHSCSKVPGPSIQHLDRQCARRGP